MRKRASVAFVVYSIASGVALAGPTVGGIQQHAGVNKDCAAKVFAYAADGSASLKEQDRFDYLKNRLVSSDAVVGPFVDFVAIGNSQAPSNNSADHPQCSGAAYSP